MTSTQAQEKRQKGGKIIFLHLHKTAGMSLRGLFVKNYRKDRHFNTDITALTAPAWENCLDRLRRMSPEEKAAYRVFKGHMPYGLHRELTEPARYITFLREPVKRVLSHYRMVLRKSQLPPDHEIDPSRPDWNLSAYPPLARSLDNGQTRMLAGADLRLPFGECTAEHLALAKQHLDEHFAFVGLSEHFDLSLMLLNRECGWKWHFYVPDNVSSRRDALVTPEIEEQIRTLNRFDLELYAYAEEKFSRLVEKYSPGLKWERRLYTWGNSVHQRIHLLRQARKKRLGAPRRPAMRPMDAALSL
jgi:hypothetical protein